MKVSELPAFDAADYLRDERDDAAFVAAMREDGSPEEIARAAEIVERAKARRSSIVRSGGSRTG